MWLKILIATVVSVLILFIITGHTKAYTHNYGKTFYNCQILLISAASVPKNKTGTLRVCQCVNERSQEKHWLPEELCLPLFNKQ